MSKTDLKKWCKENKIESVYKLLLEKKVDIDKSCNLRDDELKKYAGELKLDLISKKRFVNGLIELRENRSPNQQVNSTVNSISENIQKRKK